MRTFARLFVAFFLLGVTVAHAESGTSPDGNRIVYGTRGERMPALVFVHGWACDRGYWKDTMNALGKDHLVVAVDLAGHGESGFMRDKWTMSAFGDDVAMVVDRLKLDRVILVGHSMGGDVVAEAAKKLGGKVIGLIWVDTYKDLSSPRTPEQVQAFMAPFRANFPEATRNFVTPMFGPNADPALVERIVVDMAAQPSNVGLGAMESALLYGREMPATLRQLGIPVVAINPDNTPTNEDSLTANGVKRVLYVRGTGHFPMLEDPKRFNSVLEDAIEEVTD